MNKKDNLCGENANYTLRYPHQKRDKYDKCASKFQIICVSYTKLPNAKKD